MFEDAPFPIRNQGAADLEAARFALLAWQDPDPAEPVSPYWSVAPMHCAELVAGSRPLLALVEAAGARIEGLRLAGGALVLKIERVRLAAQVRVGPGGAICEDAGLALRLDCALLRRVADYAVLAVFNRHDLKVLDEAAGAGVAAAVVFDDAIVEPDPRLHR